MDRSSDKRGLGRSATPRRPCKEAATEGNASASFSKNSMPSFRPSSVNEATGKSFRSNSAAKRSHLDSKRTTSSQVPSDPLESSRSTDQSNYQSDSMNMSREVHITEAGSCSASTSVGPRKTFRYKSGLHNQSCSQGPFSRIKGSRYDLRSLRCNSTSDAIPPSGSQLRKNFIKTQSSEGESSSASLEGDRRGSSCTWSRISMNVDDDRTRFSYGINSSSVRGTGVSFSRNDHETHVDVDGSSSQQFSASCSRSHHLSTNSSDNSSSRTSFTSAESGLTRLMNHNVLRRLNMDGIAEVLLALEQDQELTNEHILALETSLFPSGLNIYDQHRDMRLDIDNMSYEELLALEERMGSVSTALPEEALPKCLARSIYNATHSIVETTETGEEGDDIKCSICQEEYVTGDEMGKLVECHHGYHATCINQWLQRKNWCPICKASAASSQSSPSS